MMDKAQNQTIEKCYIVSLDNGIRTEEPVTMEVFNNFNDGSKLVQINKSVFGVYKENSKNPETSYIDDYDIIKSDIAELFDVDHEETKRIVNENDNIGVFTLLNYSKDIETRVSATTMLNNIVHYINNGQISEEDSLWISETLRLPDTTIGNSIKDKTQIERIIEFGIISLRKNIELQSGIPMDERSIDALRKNYIRMILFDYLVGRNYRGLDYYLIVTTNEQGNIIWKDARFSPVSVSNNIEKDKLVGPNEYQLNGKLLDKTTLLQVLFDKYYKEIKKMAEALNDAKRLYKDAISRIIYNNTSLDKAVSLEEQINQNLDAVNAIQENIEKELDKNQKINKVERTMATQSLNVRVTTKLDLIQKKYPINPKEHPELIAEQKKKNKEEEIKLIVENDNDEKKGFANAFVLISAVAFICGIGFGIAFVLLKIGSL